MAIAAEDVAGVFQALVRRVPGVATACTVIVEGVVPESYRVLAALLMETEIRRSAYQQAIRCLIQGHPEQKDRVPITQVQQC